MSTDKEKSKSATKKKSAVKKTTPKKVSTTKKTKVKEESLDTKPISQETFSVLMDVVSDANKREEPVKKTKAKTPVQAWMEEHQVTLNRCYTWCSTNDWRFAHNQQSEYDAQLSLVITILDTLKRFTEQFTAYLQYKYVSEFVDKYASTVRQFVDRCRSYVDSNNWILIDNDDLRNLERDFQVGIVKDVDRINEKYNKLGLKEEISYFTLSFHADKVAPFLMKGIIEEKFPKVKELQESIQKMEEEQNALVYPTYNVYSCLNSTELFRNIKNPPPYDPLKHYYEQPQSTIDFFEEEYNKIVNGVNIGGIHISGFLYWHINYFKTDIPMAMFKGTPLYNPRLERIITHPFLRDNELFFDHCYTKASQENVGVFVFGTRRFGKALWVKEKLRYEDGSFRDIKHVRKGDKIIAGDGYPTVVTGVFPQGVVDLYKITFSDKREIVCCDEHLWKVFDGKTWNVLNLKTIRERMYTGDKFSIPPTPITGYTTDLVLNWFGSVPEMSKVEYFGKDEAICISVSNSDKLFLTSNGIVTHNTVLESSYIGWRNTVVPNSESLVIGGDDGDLQKLSKTIEVSFSNVHPAFALPRNNNDWTSHIQFGLKSKDGVRIPYSDIYIRNVNAGTKQGGVKTAGATPTAWVCDEAGKFACKLMYFQAIPSFQNPTGWGVTPILVGCLTAGNKVFARDGRVVNVEDLRKEDGIVGYSGAGSLQEDIDWLKPPAKKECVEVVAQHDSVSCSVDHPIMVRCGKGQVCFKRADELREGDFIAVIDEVPIFGNMSQEHAYLLGMIVGDGCSKNGNVLISVNEPEVLDYLKVNYSTNIVGVKTSDTNVEGCKLVSVRGVNALLKQELMYGKTKSNKQLPKNLYAYDRKSLSEFIAGYFDADGNVKTKGGKYVSVVLSSVNKHLLVGVKYALLKFGIHCIITKESRKSGYVSSHNIIYRLYINSKEDVVKFRNFIPLKVSTKWNVLYNAKFDDVLYKSHCKYEFVFRESFPKGGYFKDKFVSGVRFSKVKSVVNIGEQDVHNMTTSTSHTYLSGCVISGNTGGETSLSADAREMLLNPKANKILAMDWDALENFVPEEKLITWKRKTFGIFVPAQLSYKEGLVKDITTLADFHKSDSESLKNIDLHVTNWQLANDVINQSRKDMEDDKTAIAQEKMGYPIDPMECFLNKVENPFCAREAQDHYDTIVEEGDTGKKVDFIRESDGKTLKSFFSDKELAPYPFPGGNVDAPFVVFEDPPLNPQVDYTYASGLDHYKHDKADTDSVGVMYIFKRQVDINDPWADRIVAVYASRPDTIDAFNDNCEMLLDGYGAICLMENADTSFEQHLRRKFKHNIYLANGQDLAKDVINPTAQQNNPVGLSPTPKNKAYCLSLVINYCNEMITVGYDDEGVPIQKRGVYRIPDPLLLKEIINFSYDGNFDRIVAFGHALALSRYWDRLNLLPDTRRNNLDEDRVRAMYQQMRSGKSPYSAGSKNPYNTGSKSPYRTYR